jgi:hypothetical protein
MPSAKKIIAGAAERHAKLQREREWELDLAKTSRRMQFDTSGVEGYSEAHPLLEINPNETALVSTKDRFCVVAHHGDIDPQTGLEVVEVIFDLLTAESAMAIVSSGNNIGKRSPSDPWLEILTYPEVFRRMHGGITPAKADGRKRAKSPKKARVSKPRIAKIA